MTPSTSSRRALAAIGALGLVVASFMAASTVTSGAAQARESSPDQAPPLWGTLLYLTVTKGDQTIGTAVLTCDPPGGLHPYPAAACADLVPSFGDFLDLPGVPDAACTDMYDPVQANAFGWWRSPSPRFFSNTFGNICELYRSTGWVFPLPSTFPPPPSTPVPPPTVTVQPPPTGDPGPTWTPGPTGTIDPGPTVTWTPGPTGTIDPPDTTIPD